MSNLANDRINTHRILIGSKTWEEARAYYKGFGLDLKEEYWQECNKYVLELKEQGSASAQVHRCDEIVVSIKQTSSRPSEKRKKQIMLRKASRRNIQGLDMGGSAQA